MSLKKLLTFCLMVILLLNCCFGLVTVSATSLEDFSYEISSDGITITKYNGEEEDVVIAENYVIDGAVYTISKIGEYAFEDSVIESVKIPESVTEISEGAFYNCDAITAVTIPESVNEIALYAFDDCNNLTNVTILNPNVTIGDSAFGYYYSGRKYYIVDNFVMHGLENSTAQKYAIANDMTFEIYVKPVLGDVNNDKISDIRDLVRLKKILAGVVETGDCTADINGDGISSAEDLVSVRMILLHGEDNLKTHTVTFRDKDGNVLDIQKVKHSFSAIAPKVPVIDGYIFKGWSESFINVMNEMQIFAEYEADTKPTFIVDSVSANPGDKKVTLAVSVKNNPGILGMTLSVEYDEEVLTLTEASSGEALSGVLSFTKSNILKSGCNFVWDGQEITTDSIRNGTILLLTFDISNDAKTDEYPIKISYRNGDIIDGNLDSILFEIQNGKIIVS
ncbi:MAG: leucine-rich repeat protein [Clostridia bacterium]|nr:leucine-rich repeat protein [Clostridia bacterium]